MKLQQNTAWRIRKGTGLLPEGVLQVSAFSSISEKTWGEVGSGEQKASGTGLGEERAEPSVHGGTSCLHAEDNKRYLPSYNVITCMPHKTVLVSMEGQC